MAYPKVLIFKKKKKTKNERKKKIYSIFLNAC